MASCTNPDLMFNYGVVCKYLEHYEDALVAFEATSKLDPSLDGDAVRQIHEIMHTLSQLAALITTKCGLKQKRVAKILQTLAVSPVPPSVPWIGLDWIERKAKLVLSSLQTSNPSKSKSPSLSITDLSPGKSLPPGSNLDCKIIHCVSVRAAVPIVYVCMDIDGAFFALTIYTIEESALKGANTLTIREPQFTNVSVKWNEKVCKG